MAQEQYIIRLSKSDAKISVFDINMNRMSLSRRDVEIAALDTMVALSSQSEKENEKFNLCTDLSRQLENLEDNDDWVITKGDLAILRDGFKKSAENRQRPMIWSRLKELFDQIETPEKLEISKEDT